MTESPNVVRVFIAGQEYVIKTSADAKYIKSVADYVNQRMKEIEESSHETQSQLRTAVLASMNITDELFTEQSKASKLVNRVEAKTLAIKEYIDEKIENSKR